MKKPTKRVKTVKESGWYARICTNKDSCGVIEVENAPIKIDEPGSICVPCLITYKV